MNAKENLAEPYLERGFAYLSLKQYAGAIKDYDKAIKINPKDAMQESQKMLNSKK